MPDTNLLVEQPVFYLVDEHEHADGGSTMLGFWIYLMSDCLIFAVLFATYGVLGGNYAAGPAPKDRTARIPRSYP
jgi:cytochrome o ubiquinol oxidase subunit 3